MQVTSIHYTCKVAISTCSELTPNPMVDHIKKCIVHISNVYKSIVCKAGHIVRFGDGNVDRDEHICCNLNADRNCSHKSGATCYHLTTVFVSFDAI